MNLVKVAYGNDDQTSFQEPQGLLQAYPNLKGIISPTVRAVRPGQARLPGRLRGALASGQVAPAAPHRSPPVPTWSRSPLFGAEHPVRDPTTSPTRR
jgi:hypothetical protein